MGAGGRLLGGSTVQIKTQTHPCSGVLGWCHPVFAARFREGSGNCFAKRRSRFNVKGLTAPANGCAEAGCVSHTLWLTLPQYPPHKDTMTFCCRGGENTRRRDLQGSYRPISGPTVLPMFAVPVFMSYSPAENTSHRKMWSKILGDVVTPRFFCTLLTARAELSHPQEEGEGIVAKVGHSYGIAV